MLAPSRNKENEAPIAVSSGMGGLASPSRLTTAGAAAAVARGARHSMGVPPSKALYASPVRNGGNTHSTATTPFRSTHINFSPAPITPHNKGASQAPLQRYRHSMGPMQSQSHGPRNGTLAPSPQPAATAAQLCSPPPSRDDVEALRMQVEMMRESLHEAAVTERSLMAAADSIRAAAQIDKEQMMERIGQ